MDSKFDDVWYLIQRLTRSSWKSWLPVGAKNRRRLAFGLVFVVASVMALRYLLRDFTDFGIYLLAATELFDDVDLYRPRGELGAYPYPHVVLLPLWFVQQILPDTVIRISYALALGGALTSIVYDLDRAARHYGGMRPFQWGLLAFLFVRCVSSNFTNGQLSLIVSACMLRGVVHIADQREIRGGIWLGLAAATKLTPLLFLLALPVVRRFRAAAAMVTTVVVLCLVIPWPFLGTAQHVRHLQDFDRAMIAPRLGHESETAFNIGPSASIEGTLGYALQERPRNGEGRTFAYFDLDTGALRSVMLAWSTLLVATAAWAFFRPREDRKARWLEQSAVLMMMMALLSPMTRSYHMSGILWPGALLCLAAWPRRYRPLFWATAAAFAFSTTLRQRKLLGEDLWFLLEASGLPHLAMVLLLCWLAFAPRLPAGSGTSVRG